MKKRSATTSQSGTGRARARRGPSPSLALANPYGGGPNTGITLPLYYRPMPSVENRQKEGRRFLFLMFVLILAATGLAGCYYVVPAAPPPPGFALVVPEFVRERP